MLHAYCIRAAGDPPPDAALRGVDGLPVELREACGVGAWVSRPPAPPPPAPERLVAHDAVARAALRSATPLPVRFGTCFAGDAELERALCEGADGYRAALRRVAGRVEMGITLGWDAAAQRRALGGADADAPDLEIAQGPGRAYLERRRRASSLERALLERAEAHVVQVRRIMGDDLEESVVLLPAEGIAARMAHLVHRRALSDYRARVERLRPALGDVDVLLTGPWAPYSFT